MLWLLAIDTATSRGNVAVGRLDDSGTTLAAVHVRRYDGSSGHAELVLGELDTLLSEAGLTPSMVGGLIVGVGPGSFTGVRVGVSTAKALAMVTGARVLGVGSLATMAFAVEAEREAPRVAVIDARRGELFVAAYDADGAERRAPAHVHRDGLAAWGAGLEGAIVVGEIDGLEVPIEALGWRAYRSPGTDLPSAEALLGLGLARWSTAGSAAGLEPSYLRPPDAALPATPLVAASAVPGGGDAALPSGGEARLDSGSGHG